MTAQRVVFVLINRTTDDRPFTVTLKDCCGQEITVWDGETHREAREVARSQSILCGCMVADQVTGETWGGWV